MLLFTWPTTPRATVLPSWLNDWQKLPTDQVVVDDPKNNTYALYSRTFPAGTVSFDGNLASPADGALSNYFIIIKEQPNLPIVTGTNETVNGSQLGLRFQLKVYPNPQKQGEQIFMELENYDRQEKVSVTLHDIAGHKLLTQNVITDDQGQAKATIPVSNSVKPGLYFLQANAPSGNQRIKVVIQ